MNPGGDIRRRCALITTALTIPLMSCSVDELSLAGKSCPCVDGWICDPVTATCVAGGDAGICTNAAGWSLPGYAHRRRIDVTAGAVAVPAAYSVAIEADHESWVEAGQSLPNGDDVRVICAGDQLHRAVDPLSSWNAEATRLWFQLPPALAAEQSDTSCYLYYGNSSEIDSPANWSSSMGADDMSSVFLYGDDFEEHDDDEHPDGWSDQGLDPFEVVSHDTERWYRATPGNAQIHPSAAMEMDFVGDAVWSADLFHRETGTENWGALGARIKNGDVGIVVAVQAGRFTGYSENGLVLLTDNLELEPRIHFPPGSKGRIELRTLGDRVSAFWHNPPAYEPEAVTLLEHVEIPAGASEGVLGLYLERPNTETPDTGEWIEADNVIVRPYVSPEPTATLGCAETAP